MYHYEGSCSWFGFVIFLIFGCDILKSFATRRRNKLAFIPLYFWSTDAKPEQTNVEHVVDFDEALSRLGNVNADSSHESNWKKYLQNTLNSLGFSGFGKFNYVIILLSGVIITATSFETLGASYHEMILPLENEWFDEIDLMIWISGISFVFPVAECDLSLTTWHKGVISSVTSIGIISSSHVWGFLSDIKGRKSVIVPTLVLSFIASFLSSLSTSFTMLVICRFFSGFLWVRQNCAINVSLKWKFYSLPSASLDHPRRFMHIWASFTVRKTARKF